MIKNKEIPMMYVSRDKGITLLRPSSEGVIDKKVSSYANIRTIDNTRVLAYTINNKQKVGI
jgi:hypothetical protein